MKRFFSEYKTGAVKILLSVLLLIEAATLAHFGFVSVSVVCYAVSYGIIAYGVIFGALKKLFQRLKIDEELLMSEEGLRKTSNSKIFVGKPVEFREDTVNGHLEILKRIVDNEEVELIDSVMRSFISTYVLPEDVNVGDDSDEVAISN